MGDGRPSNSGDFSNETMTSGVEDVVLGLIQSDVEAVNVTEGISPATTVQGLFCSWEDMFVLDNAEDNKVFEFEGALDLVLGAEEGMYWFPVHLHPP